MQLNAAVVDRPPTADQNRMLHQTIQAVTDDIRKLSFNTAIARMMEFTNFFTKLANAAARVHGAVRAAALAVRPAHGRRAVASARPHRDAGLRTVARVRPVARQGRYGRNPGADQRQSPRRKITVAADADQGTMLEAAAKADPRIAELARRQDKSSKIVVVPGRLVNFVVKGYRRQAHSSIEELLP